MLQFGEIIRKRREEKGWTQKQLAQKLFVSDKAISRWENNQSYPDITLLLEIARVLELDYQELIEGNQYILKKQRKRRKMMWIIGILILCIIGIVIVDTLYKQSENKITEQGLDYLVSKKWSKLGYSTEEGMYIHEYISDYQKESVLEFFDVDHLAKVENHSINKFDYYFTIYTDGNYQTFCVYYENQNYYIYVPTYHENYVTGVTYLSQKDISNFQNFFESLSRYDYDLHHEVECLSPLQRVEGQTLIDLTQFVTPSYDYDYGLGARSAGRGDEHYYCLFSETIDIQTIRYEEGVIYLTGEDRKYSKAYFCAFEIEGSVHTLIYNGEVIYDHSNI